MTEGNLSDIDEEDLYDREYDGEYDPERRFLLEKASLVGNKALEIAWGTGIVSERLAENAVTITGIDLDEESLAVAKKKKFASACKYHLMDMRDFKINDSFPLAYLTGNAFMFLLNTMDQKRFFSCVYNHLEKDGLLIFDTRPPKQSLQEREESDFSLVKQAQITNSLRTKVYYKTKYDAMNQLVKYDVKRDYYVDGKYEKTETGDVTLKLTFPVEMELLLSSCGFAIEDIYGAFDKDPIDAEGDKMVYVCKKITNSS